MLHKPEILNFKKTSKTINTKNNFSFVKTFS